MSNRRKTTRDRLNQQLNNNEPNTYKHQQAKLKVELMDLQSMSSMHDNIEKQKKSMEGKNSG